MTYNRLSRPDLRRFTPDLRVYVDRNDWHRVEVLTLAPGHLSSPIGAILGSRTDRLSTYNRKTLSIWWGEIAENWLARFDRAGLVVEIVRD